MIGGSRADGADVKQLPLAVDTRGTSAVTNALSTFKPTFHEIEHRVLSLAHCHGTFSRWSSVLNLNFLCLIIKYVIYHGMITYNILYCYFLFSIAGTQVYTFLLQHKYR